MKPLTWAIAGYIALQLVIGFVASRRVASEADYLLAGRRLGYGLVTLSVFATWFGAETCVGSAGAIYAGGLADSSADPFGYALCLVVVALVFSGPLWRLRLTTIADLFRDRFSPRVEKIAACLMIPTSLLWASAQIRAFGQVLSASSGLTVTIATLTATLVVIIYTVAGGLLADAVTDFVQGIVLVVGLVVLGVVIVREVGGPTAALAQIDAARLSLLPSDRPLLRTLEAWSVPVIGSMFAQELVQRVVASRSIVVARRSTLMAASLYCAVGSIPVLIGLLGPTLLPGLGDPEHLLPELARQKLGSIGYVLLIGALVSAILSTVDTTLLVAASLFSHNLIAPLRPGLSDRKKILYARGGVAVFGAIGCVLALFASSVTSLVEQASAFGSAGIAVSVVFGLKGRFGGPRSAGAAMLSGTAVYVASAFCFGLGTPFLLSLLAAFVVYVAVAAFEGRKSS